MNPWDRPDGEGRRDIWELPRGFPAQGPPTPGAARTGTYPGCRRGRTHSTPWPAPRTRSQLAAAASLASCELCAAGGAPGAPSRRAWAPSPGEGGELRRPECDLWLRGSGAGAGEASLRGEGLRTRASWPAGEVGGEAGSRDGRRGRPVRPELRVPRAACALRAPWLRGEAPTPARGRWRPWFAGLAQSRRWSRYLAAQPRGARPAAALAAGPGAAHGEHSGRPRSRSQHPPPASLAAAARQRCTPASQRAQPGRPRARCTCDPRRRRPGRRPSRGRALHGNFLSGCRRRRLRGSGASLARPSRPQSHPPPRHVYSAPKEPSPVRAALPAGRLNC